MKELHHVKLHASEMSLSKYIQEEENVKKVMTHPIWFYHLRRSNLLIDYRCQDACCKLLNLNPKKVVSEQEDTRYRTPQVTPRLFGKLLTFLVSLGNSLLPTKLHTVSILTFSMRVWSKLRQRTSWCTWEMSNLIRVHWPNIEGLANWLSNSLAQPKTFKEEKASSAWKVH